MKLINKVKQELKALGYSQSVEVKIYNKKGWSKITLDIVYAVYMGQHGFKGEDFSVAFDNVKMNHIEKLQAILEASPTPFIKGVFLPDHHPLELDLSGEDCD